MQTAAEAIKEDRVYTPASIEDACRSIPGIGRKVRIQYYREYTGSANEKLGRQKMITRRGVVVQKCEKHFTLEMIPEEPPASLEQMKKYTKRGRYNLSFLYVDLILGRVKILGVV